MGVNCWTEIKVKNESTANALTFTNIVVATGILFKVPPGDKSVPFPPGELQNVTIGSYHDYTIGACGTDQPPSGASGSFTIMGLGTIAATITYNAPITGNNGFTATAGQGWVVTHTGGNTTNAGTLGNVTVEVRRV